MHAAARDDTFLRDDPQNPRLWHAVLYVFLTYVFVTGGSSQERGWTDAIAQLLALPVLAVGVLRVKSLPFSLVRSCGLIAFAAIVLLPWLQLLPLGNGPWNMAPARSSLARDLAAAGVQAHATNWTLTPAATLRSALSLIPAAALFVGALGVDCHVQRRLLILCVALPLASLILGFLQLGLPQDSLLNPYPQWAPSMNGIFANPNHQGTAMLIGLAVCLAFAVGAYGAMDKATGYKRNPWPAIIAGTTLLLGLPLTNSRAAVVIGVLLLVAAPMGMAASALRRSGHGRRGVVALMVVAALAALGLSAATGWMKVDEVEEIRWIMRQATFALGMLHSPWGSGVGGFVPVFQQALPASLMLPKYINAAHNDFAQVWLEAGAGGLLIATGAIVALALAAVSHWRLSIGDRRLAWGALLGFSVFAAHAGADYALRTPALLAVAALLGSVLVAQGSRCG